MKTTWGIVTWMVIILHNPVQAQGPGADHSTPSRSRDGNTPRVEIGFFGGAFVPLSNLTRNERSFCGYDYFGNYGCWRYDGPAKHHASISFGGRLTLWLDEQIGIEGALNHAPSNLKVTLRDEYGLKGHDRGANLWIESARVVFSLASPTGSARLHILGGVAYVSHRGEAFEGLKETADFGGVAGFGARLDLGAAVAVRIDIEGYFYSFKPDELDVDPDLLDGTFQADIFVTAGIALAFER